MIWPRKHGGQARRLNNKLHLAVAAQGQLSGSGLAPVARKANPAGCVEVNVEVNYLVIRFPVTWRPDRPLIANPRGVPRTLRRSGHLVDDGAVYCFLPESSSPIMSSADDGVVAFGIKPITPRIRGGGSSLPGRSSAAEAASDRRVAHAGGLCPPALPLGLAQARPPSSRAESLRADDMRTPASRTRAPGMSRQACHCSRASLPL